MKTLEKAWSRGIVISCPLSLHQNVTCEKFHLVVAILMPLAGRVPCAQALQPEAVINALMSALNADSENVRRAGAYDMRQPPHSDRPAVPILRKICVI
jgi:hypothetical protein